MRAQGEFCTVRSTHNPSKASFVPFAALTSQAGQALSRVRQTSKQEATGANCSACWRWRGLTAGPVGGGRARGRRQGVAGHRGDTPSEARGAEGSRAAKPDTIVPKTQTTSPITAHFQCFSPRWSAFWALQHLKPPPHRLKQGECTTRGSDTPTTHHQGASCRAKPPLPHSKQPPGRRTPPNWIGNANLDRLLRSG